MSNRFPDIRNPDDVRALCQAARTLREASLLCDTGRYREAAELARMAQMWLADCAEYSDSEQLPEESRAR